MKCLTFDIGGSSVKCAVVELNLGGAVKIGQEVELPLNEKNIGCLVKLIKKGVDDFYENQRDIDCIGVCTTGSVNPLGVVRRAGFIDGYEKFDWKKVINDYRPEIKNIYTINDGRASAPGSYAHEGFTNKILAHLVVGTGIGGGCVVNGEIFAGAHDLGSNFGHIKVEHENGLVCSCRKKGCLENYAASKAIIRYYSDNQEITVREISEFARNGDMAALEAFKRAGFYLGVGLSDIMNVIDPDLITIGGGVVEAASMPNGDNIFINSAISTAREYAKTKNAELINIKESELGNSAGIIGVAYYSLKKMNVKK